MKLLRLKLNVDFRSLAAGFELHFLREEAIADRFKFNPYCLVGRNGSGKSNVLEALAAIFYHIECIYLDFQPVGFQEEKATPDAFELEYLILNHTIRIVKQAGQRPVLHRLNQLGSEEDPPTELTRAEVKAFLPAYILGYSSGHNEILSLPFFKMRFIHFDEYCDHLTKELHYVKPEGRMIYLDEQFSQAILICHFLFPTNAVTKVFKDKIGLTGIRRFRIIIRRHHRIEIDEERLRSMSAEEKQDKTKTTVELTSKLAGPSDGNSQRPSSVIEKLIKCSTTHHEEEYPDGEGFDLYLDYWVNEATKRAFEVHFGEASGESDDVNNAKSALNLFRSFQTLLTLNHYKVDKDTKAELYQSPSLYVNETIPTPASHERIMRIKDGELMKEGVTETLYLKHLSDGEHQLLHTIGLCLLYRHEPALFLLDEPETHLNPDWRASYISTLRAALEADDSPNQVTREVLLTSHSPFIISDCRRDNVRVFTRDPETREVTCRIPEIQTFGASATLITCEVFDRPETIGDFANAELKKLEALARQPGQEPRTVARKLDKALGDSIEKTLAISRILYPREP